jgi:surfeit locus 1 family protein
VSAVQSRLRGLIAPATFTALTLAILLGLGFWQLDRRVWKEELIARVEARTTAPVAEIPPESEWANVTAERDEYRRVRAVGVFRPADEALVFTSLPDPRGKFSGPGYWVLTPLVLESGATVIVNRGFVPDARRDPATRREGQVEGPVSVTGLLRMSERAGWFTPDNEPARNAWYRRDPAEIARARGLDRPAPFMIDADATPNPGGLPQGGETRLNFPNNHLQYAITWFGLAGALLAVFAGFARQRLKGTR